MNTELQMLVWSVVLGLAQIMFAATLGTMQRGPAWNVGARDEIMPPLTGMAGRADRALWNFLETFPFFAVAVLAVIATQRSNAHTVLGAQLYFWARLAYVPMYAAGIAYIRTLVWVVSIIGLVMVLLPLF
jgi:uncharacterized MAPEG superfamily protein